MEEKDPIKFIGKNIHKMSFIIGAGFSKNISKSYLSWWELLQDMIYEMYPSEIIYHHMSTDDLIQKYGYLGIASEYIRRKGYHEAIDQYIEKRTPILKAKEENGKMIFDLVLDGKIIEEDVNVSMHRTLLGFNAKSIYTFNYDNALDVYADLVYSAEDRVRNDQNEDMLKKLYKDKAKHEELCAKIDENEESVSNPSNSPIQMNSSKKSLIEEYNDFIESYLENGANVIKCSDTISDVISKNKIILNAVYDRCNNDIQNWYRDIRNRYLLIKKSSDISINEADKRLYKLHGCIRKLDYNNKFCGEYGFDYDNHTQYIIAQEDYDTYNEKHEAFVDLMRINLLKDPFCIIGFSCDDPNFLLWMNWVKDIQDKPGVNKEIDRNKFYINVGDKELPEDKQLLLHNHYIEIIDLYKAFPMCRNIQERLRLFFDKIKEIQSSSSVYNKLWVNTKFPFPINKHKKEDVILDRTNLEDAWNDTINNSLSFWGAATNIYRLQLLTYYRDIMLDNWLDDDLLKLLYIASNRENIPYSVFIPEKFKDFKEFTMLIHDSKLKQYFQYTEALLGIMKRGKAEIVPSQENDDVQRNLLMLQYAYNFQEKKYMSAFNDWQPSRGLLKVIKSIMDGQNLDLGKIESLSDSRAFSNIQEEYLALQLLYSFIRFNTSNKVRRLSLKIAIEKIEEEYPNLISYNNLLQDIIKELVPKEKVKSLGAVKRSMTFDSYNKPVMSAIKMLMLYAKSGMLPVMNNISYVSDDDWYNVAKNSYQYYPYACLYYSSLYNNKELAKRIAQLYAYSNDEDVKNAVNDLLPKILKACCVCKNKQRVNTLFVYATHFIKNVNEKKWAGEFKRLFKKFNWYNRDFMTYIDESQYTFALEALKLLHDPSFKLGIIKTVLEKGDRITEWDNNLIINCSHGIESLSKEEATLLDKIMHSTVNKDQCYVVFNLSEFFHRRKLISWIVKTPDKLLGDNSLIEAIAYHAKEATTLKSKLYNLIRNSNKLWDTGISIGSNGEISVSDSAMMNLDRIEYHTKLNRETSEYVYMKMKESLLDLEKASDHRLHEIVFSRFSSILINMHCFLHRHNEDLLHNSDFEHVFNKCTLLYEKISGVKSPLYKLMCKEDYIINEGVLEVYNMAMSYGIKSFSAEYHLMLNHLIQKDTNCIAQIFYVINRIITINQSFFMQGDFLKLLKAVVYIYHQEEQSPEWNVPAKKDVVIKEVHEIEEFLKRLSQKV